ncbi:unnamed protein product [Victoria cruziana]
MHFLQIFPCSFDETFLLSSTRFLSCAAPLSLLQPTHRVFSCGPNLCYKSSASIIGGGWMFSYGINQSVTWKFKLG